MGWKTQGWTCLRRDEEIPVTCADCAVLSAVCKFSIVRRIEHELAYIVSRKCTSDTAYLPCSRLPNTARGFGLHRRAEDGLQFDSAHRKILERYANNGLFDHLLYASCDLMAVPRVY